MKTASKRMLAVFTHDTHTCQRNIKWCFSLAMDSDLLKSHVNFMDLNLCKSLWFINQVFRLWLKHSFRSNTLPCQLYSAYKKKQSLSLIFDKHWKHVEKQTTYFYQKKKKCSVEAFSFEWKSRQSMHMWMWGKPTYKIHCLGRFD